MPGFKTGVFVIRQSERDFGSAVFVVFGGDGTGMLGIIVPEDIDEFFECMGEGLRHMEKPKLPNGSKGFFYDVYL